MVAKCPDQDGTATVQSTVDAVQANGGDITALPADAALANIDSWIDQLDDNEDASKVTGNLEELQDALGEQPINGPLVGMLLITLAEDTRQVAGTAPGVSTLVSALQSGGEKLTEGAFGSSSLLDQTLAAVRAKAADITTLGVPTATKNIDSWITELRGMDGTDDMIENLETLKTELGASDIDGRKAYPRSCSPLPKRPASWPVTTRGWRSLPTHWRPVAGAWRARMRRRTSSNHAIA